MTRARRDGVTVDCYVPLVTGATKASETRAAGELFRQHGAMVYRRALQLLGNKADAEEAAQEVFVRVLRTSAGYEGRGSVTSWLYRITTHYCLNRIRDRARRRELFEEHVAPSIRREAPAPAPGALLTLRWLLANADEQQARAAVYVYLDGMSYREAAELLGVSKRTVGNLVERFREWARGALERRDDAGGAGEERDPRRSS